MNITHIYNSLQNDISNILGVKPRLEVSMVASYEALWKDITRCIEYIGDSESCTYCIALDGECLSYDDCYAGSLLEGAIMVVVSRVHGEELPALFFDCPAGVLSLVIRFLGSGCPTTLRCLRQICLLTYKSKTHEVTQEQEKTAVDGFCARNSACYSLNNRFYSKKIESTRSDIANVLKIARLLANLVLQPVDFRNLRPSHGPGAVSDAKRGYDKWLKLDSRTTRLCDKLYPMSEWNVPTPEWFDHHSAKYSDSVCKFAIVPKDKRGPRVICTQPVGLMWIQQGQLAAVNRAIETSSIMRTNRLQDDTSFVQSIKFDDQRQNGDLALESSRTREFATIDLKDASDLVSWGLVRFLFNKETVRFLAASRAMYVRMPSKELVKLHMFAPMGSAMCFPVESLVFWCVAAAATYVQRSVTYEYLTKVGPRGFLEANPTEVFVFGDDILVRRESCKFVCDVYSELGFKPNLSKTFAEGFYRESCGVDAYRGTRLDIARIQTPTLTCMPEAYATIDLANRLRSLGMRSLSNYMQVQVESFLGFNLAAGITGGPVWDLGFPCDDRGADMALAWNLRHNARIRFNPNLQYWEAYSIVARPLSEAKPQDDRCRLFRGLTTRVDEHTASTRKSGAAVWLVPDNTQYYLGWVRAF